MALSRPWTFASGNTSVESFADRLRRGLGRLADAIHAFQWTIVRSGPSDDQSGGDAVENRVLVVRLRHRFLRRDAPPVRRINARSSVCNAASDGMSIIIAI